MNIYLFLVICY